MPQLLCSLANLKTNGSIGASAIIGDTIENLLVVRKGEGVFAYLNRCPHVGAPMEWRPNEFLDESGEYILCGMHGALFQIQDGLCIDGPCYGDYLTPVPVNVVDQQVYLLEDNSEQITGK